jgi:hypothetical protein
MTFLALILGTSLGAATGLYHPQVALITTVSPTHALLPRSTVRHAGHPIIGTLKSRSARRNRVGASSCTPGPALTIFPR